MSKALYKATFLHILYHAPDLAVAMFSYASMKLYLSQNCHSELDSESQIACQARNDSGFGTGQIYRTALYTVVDTVSKRRNLIPLFFSNSRTV